MDNMQTEHVLERTPVSVSTISKSEKLPKRNVSETFIRFGKSHETSTGLAIGGACFVRLEKININDIQSEYYYHFKKVSNKYTDGLLDEISHYCSSSSIISQAENFINLLDKYINKYSDLDLPKISHSIPEDGELLLEWQIPEVSVGIAIDEINEDTSWYVVTDDEYKSTNAYGYFNQDEKTIIPFLVKNFVNASKE